MIDPTKTAPFTAGVTREAAQRVAIVCAVVMGCIGFLGYFVTDVVDRFGLGSQHHISSNNIFYFLFFRFERWTSVFSVAWSGFALLYFLRQGSRTLDHSSRPPDRRLVPFLAVLAGLIAGIGTYTVCLNHPLAMDEYLTNFQAKIFLSGHVFAPLGEFWNQFGGAMTPALAIWDPTRGTWTANYLPVYAAMRTPFVALGAETLLNPLMTLGSVWLIASIARRLWPDDAWAPVMAGLFLAFSPQVLVTGMTAYSMPAHLFLNLLWLALYLRDDRVGLGWAPWVGIASMNLHQPNIHAIFVAPFLIRMVLERRWGRSTYFASIYLVGCAFCLYWMKLKAQLPAPGETGDDLGQLRIVLGFFSQFGFRSWINTGVLFPQIFLWQSWAVGFFALASLRRVRSLPKPLFDLFCGLVLCLLFYFLYGFGQGHGWGNRTFYPFLGGFCLLAVAGWNSLASLPGRRTVLAASLAITLFLEFPYRCFEVYSVTEPFATADRYLRDIKDPLVIVDTVPIWYGQDLVRNDPFLTNTPKYFFAVALDPARIDALSRMGKVRVVKAPELLTLGLSDRRREAPP